MTIVNPHVRYKFVRDDQQNITGVRVEAPVKGVALAETELDRTRDEALFTFFLILSVSPDATGPLSSLSDAERARLETMGYLIPADCIPAQVFYECDVDAPPRELLPVHAADQLALPAPAADLIVEPTLQVYGEGGPPPELRGRLKLDNPFHPDRGWLSVGGDVAVPNFQSAAPASAALIAGLADGTLPPASLDAGARSRFANAGILRPAAEVARRRSARAAGIAAAQAQLTGERYVVLKHVIRPRQIAALREYYRAFIAEGHVCYGDQDWSNRFLAYRDPLTYFFETQLTSLISEVAGEPVKPSFAFFTSYRPGADLPPHKDRKQCYLAMSVLLDHAQPDDISAWPIFVQPPGATDGTAVHQGLGDGLLYYGEEVLHWRRQLKEGHSTLWFLFWVPESFDQSLD